MGAAYRCPDDLSAQHRRAPAHRPFIDNAQFVFIDEISRFWSSSHPTTISTSTKESNKNVYDKLREIVANARMRYRR